MAVGNYTWAVSSPNSISHSLHGIKERTHPRGVSAHYSQRVIPGKLFLVPLSFPAHLTRNNAYHTTSAEIGGRWGGGDIAVSHEDGHLQHSFKRFSSWTSASLHPVLFSLRRFVNYNLCTDWHDGTQNQSCYPVTTTISAAIWGLSGRSEWMEPCSPGLCCKCVHDHKPYQVLGRRENLYFIGQKVATLWGFVAWDKDPLK